MGDISLMSGRQDLALLAMIEERIRDVCLFNLIFGVNNHSPVDEFVDICGPNWQNPVELHLTLTKIINCMTEARKSS